MKPPLGYEVQHLVTPEHEAGLLPVAWSWERYGGMYNAFPEPQPWDEADIIEHWQLKGFIKPRPLFLQTPLQAAAPQLLAALEAFMDRFDAYQQSKPIEQQCLVTERDQARKAIALARGKPAA